MAWHLQTASFTTTNTPPWHLQVAEGDYVLPPLTLLAVKEVLDEFEYLPGQPPIKQKCIVMSPTFMMSPSLASADAAAGKFAPSTTFLTCTRRASNLRHRPCCAQYSPRSPPTPLHCSLAHRRQDRRLRHLARADHRPALAQDAKGVGAR